MFGTSVWVSRLSHGVVYREKRGVKKKREKEVVDVFLGQVGWLRLVRGPLLA